MPFNTTIQLENRIPMLAEKIIEKELAGVLIWAIEGLKRLLKRDGFVSQAPEVMMEALRKAKIVSDDVMGWLSDRVQTVAGEARTRKNEVYEDYREWCNENDFTPKAPSSFWLHIKRTRTDITIKKFRFKDGPQNACSIILRPKEPNTNAANDHCVARAA